VVTNFANLDSAVLSLEKLGSDETTWTVLQSLDMIANGSATEYKSTTFNGTGTGTYRFTYKIVAKSGVTLSTSNTGYAITMDNLVIKN
jgi:hypothetical protein